MKQSKHTLRRAFGRRDAVILVLLLIMVAFFLHLYFCSRPFSSKLSRRAVCAANICGIGKGLFFYAKENNDCFPIAPHAPATDDNIGRVTYAPGKIGTHRNGRIDDPNAGQTCENDTEMSTTRNLWMLVRTAHSSTGSYICPESGDQKNDEDNPQIFWDFRNYSEISYGYQVPYGKHGRPSLTRPAYMPLVADKGPFGAALENGLPPPGTNMPKSNAVTDEWIPWNSSNHGGEGQNVEFGDGSYRFERIPIVGVKKDNIYTRWSRADGGSDTDEIPRIHGTPPTGNETPWSDTDTLIYP